MRAWVNSWVSAIIIIAIILKLKHNWTISFLFTIYICYPYTFRGRNECKELSILNVGTLRREIKLQTIFHKLFAQGHTSCHLKCPYKMYSWLCTYLLSSLLRKPFIPYLCFFFVDNDIMHTITLVYQITFVLFSFYDIIVPCIVIVFQMWEKVSSH